MWYDALKGMAKIYGKQVENDKMTLDEVPVRWQDKVRAAYEAGHKEMGYTLNDDGTVTKAEK